LSFFLKFCPFAVILRLLSHQKFIFDVIRGNNFKNISAFAVASATTQYRMDGWFLSVQKNIFVKEFFYEQM